MTLIGGSRIDEASCGDLVAVGTSNRQRRHQKVLAELVFGLALSLFSGDGGSQMQRVLIWDCNQR